MNVVVIVQLTEIAAAVVKVWLMMVMMKAINHLQIKRVLLKSMKARVNVR